jgi:asparagine synthase (glutamine-hydrolysing)
MCGIAGFQARGEDDIATAQALLGELAHRGPDGSWTEEVGGWRLVQNRLAIIDLSPAVAYPMRNEDASLALLFNGEVYNHSELRHELRSSGHTFSTMCDAEVVIHGFEQWGAGVFPRLEGMWALAIADSRSGEVILARDPTGIKPLYRTTSERFAFASEVTALVAAGLSTGAHDPEAITEYLAFHYVPPPRTGIADVRAVPPGTFVRRSLDGHEEAGTWTRPEFGGNPSRRVRSEELDAVFQAAVARQLRADVPVGIFLSGGLDSSLLLSYAAAAGAKPRTFTLAFSGHGGYDESETAARLAKHYAVPHERVELDVSFPQALGEVARAYDVPMADGSAIATIKLAQHARRHVTVALTGTGGDDLFAGYYRHRAHRLRPLVERTPAALRERLSHLDPGRGGERRTRRALARSYLIRLASAGGASPWDQYLSLMGNSTSEAVLEAVCQQPVRLADARARVWERHRPSDRRTTLDAIQEFEFATYVDGDLMVKEDRATMAAGVEGRVPFLDDTVRLLATQTTPRQRAGITKGKVLMREVARKRLPAGSARQGKRGFAVPLGDLMQGAWRKDAMSWLEAHDSDLVSTSELAGFVSEPGRATDVWALSVLCAWEQRVRAAREAGGKAAHAA